LEGGGRSGLGFARWPALGTVHPATRRPLAGWGYAYDAWSLRRFDPTKRHAVLICTLEAALSDTQLAGFRTGWVRARISRYNSFPTTLCAAVEGWSAW
jgi:hypothetical protein